MAPRSRACIVYIALALVTIALGLWVHRGASLAPVARDITGDALWAAMMAWWIGALAPSVSLAKRSTAAFSICVLVELSQLIHTASLDAIRATTLGHLILGSGFDPRDIGAYALGIAMAAGCELLATSPGRRRQTAV